MKNKTSIILLTLIIIVGAFFRFYKLDWGQGLFTHPDEYYIVISANQLSFPNQMNPHFFNYGGFSIYLNYFTKQLSAISLQLSDLNPFLIGRFYSALFSTLTIPLIYLISLIFMNKKYSLLAAALVALTPGLIQQAHFLTPESNLIFFIFLSLTFLLYFVKQRKVSFLIFSSITLGFALGVKVSSAVFLLPIILTIFLVSRKSPISLISQISLTLIITLITFFIVTPFAFLDFPNFLSSFRYESNLAMGSIPVFYTRQFINTIPVLFQFEKIYPFTLGPALLVFGIAGFFLMIFSIIKNLKNSSFCLVIVSCFLVFFIINAYLFAKWTRFLSPTFPFFAIFSAYLLFKISQLKISKFLNLFLVICILVLSSIWTLSFFSIYTKDDVRLQTSSWIQNNLPPSTVLMEEGNMIDVPLSEKFQKISLNFYDLDENILTQQKLKEDLEKSDYFIIQSRRVFANHQRLPEQFPKTAQLYNDLFSGKLDFIEIKELNSFPQISLLGYNFEFPDENAEETWSVFDHPVIRIFQKKL
ncbi:MAG: phospholipid carrier-dependent glycosyltransferase [Candidatus Daviesbacteria bacterium]|nr:phospholipid carrier-dependent glycosyltransferase [Candidatus Daviesbacteria bacterium]